LTVPGGDGTWLTGAHGVNAITVVEDEVRELVRRRGLDPAADPGAVRLLVDEVITDYDERSVSGTLPQLVDAVHAARAVFDAVAGFGPLQKYLDDPTVEEIWINEPTKVFVARRGLHELTTTILTADEVRDLVERMLKSSGRRVDLSTPFVDAMLPGGSRLHVVIPDITRVHWSVNIRKFVVRATHHDDLVQLGTLTGQAARFLEAAVASGLNILVAGGTQAGKTTLLNCLTAAIPSGERVVTAEEVFELKVPLPDVVSMQCRQPSLEGTGEIKLRRLVKEALRMRPSRIVVGEVRQEESLDLSRYTTYPMGYSGNTSTPAGPERPFTRGSPVTRWALSSVCSVRSRTAGSSSKRRDGQSPRCSRRTTPARSGAARSICPEGARASGSSARSTGGFCRRCSSAGSTPW
jgi:pilus assembly protein CpaF